MESKIQIDATADGLPQIRIDYKLTGDLRDKTVGRFLYTMGIPSEREVFWAFCRLGHETKSTEGGSVNGALVFIEPIFPDDLGHHISEMKRCLPDSENKETKKAEPISELALIDQMDNLLRKKLSAPLWDKWDEIHSYLNGFLVKSVD